MSDIKLGPDGDILVDGPDLQQTTGVDAIEQHLKQRLKTFYGEYFLDIRRGIPYFQHVLIKNPDPVIVDTVFKRQVLNTPGAEELLEFDIDVDISTRVMTLSFKARTSEGVIDFSEEIP